MSGGKASGVLELSLGEIIERNKGAFKIKGKRPVNAKKGGKGNGVVAGGISKPGKPQQAGRMGKPGNRKPPAPIAKAAAPLVDARMKIIQKTRSKIGDARERLNQRLRQGDARSRITPKGRSGSSGGKRPMEGIPRRTLQSASRAALVPNPSRYRNSGSSTLPRGGLSRTIRNGSSRPPILRGGTAYMDRERERSLEPDWNSRMQALPRLEIHVPTIRDREPLLRDREPLLRDREPLLHRTHMDSFLPTAYPHAAGPRLPPPSLKGVNNGWAGYEGFVDDTYEMDSASNYPASGHRVFGRDLESNSWSRPMKTIPQQVVYRSSRDYVKSRLEPARQQEGYRIVVSNLQSSVTHEDIKELFEDVGVLIGSRVVRPGTAEVVYKNLEDAITAVDTYHNRQLDGQPMKCLLVKSNSTSKVGKDIMPDISTVHHALFTK